MTNLVSESLLTRPSLQPSASKTTVAILQDEQEFPQELPIILAFCHTEFRFKLMILQRHLLIGIPAKRPCFIFWLIRMAYLQGLLDIKFTSLMTRNKCSWGMICRMLNESYKLQVWSWGPRKYERTLIWEWILCYVRMVLCTTQARDLLVCHCHLTISKVNAIVVSFALTSQLPKIAHSLCYAWALHIITANRITSTSIINLFPCHSMLLRASADISAI